jgi:hypothetical protein
MHLTVQREQWLESHAAICRCKSLSVAPLYSHVQSHYWNVGFLRYWTVLQVNPLLLREQLGELRWSAAAQLHPGCALSAAVLHVLLEGVQVRW